MTEPIARDFQLAYELLRPVPFDVRPVDHFAQLIAEFRAELQTKQSEESNPCPSQTETTPSEQ